MSDERKYWFPAKRYGWGWGPPSSWQGWVVLIIYFVLLGLGALRFLPDREPFHFLAFTGILCVLLIAICLLKGEPPKWRWGDKR